MLERLLNLSLGGVATLGIVILFLYFLLQYILDPLRDIPGPFLARFTRLWYFLEIYKGTYELTDIELHKIYGAIVRIAPYEYSIDDVEAARTIYGHGTSFIKAPWYWAWMPPDTSKSSLFADRDPVRHGVQRRKFSAPYTMSALIGYESFVNDCTSLMTQRFSEIAKTGRTTDLQHWLQCYAFDVIGDITFANRFGFLDMGEDKESVFKAIDARGFYSTHVGVFSWIHRFLFPLLPKTGGHGYVFNYALKQIEDRQRSLKDPKNTGHDGPPDIMTKFLMAHEDGKMSKVDLTLMCFSNIAAGSDTTSITLSGILYHLLKYPQTYRKLQKELDDAAKEARISDPITFKEAQELPYLQAVLKEGLRIHPATGLGMQRTVPPQGTTICGRFIPGNSTVGINAWVAHRNTSMYGPDADTWRPERWLEIEEVGRGAEVEKYFFAFGMGSRTCIGKNISLLEMSKLIPQLVRRFDFELDESLNGREWKTLNRWFVKQQDFKGRVFVRGQK